MSGTSETTPAAFPGPRHRWVKRRSLPTHGHCGGHLGRYVVGAVGAVGAVGPASGQLVSLIVAHGNTEVFHAFLDITAEEVPAEEGKQVHFVLESTGWHKSACPDWHHIKPVYRFAQSLSEKWQGPFSTLQRSCEWVENESAHGKLGNPAMAGHPPHIRADRPECSARVSGISKPRSAFRMAGGHSIPAFAQFSDSFSQSGLQSHRTAVAASQSPSDGRLPAELGYQLKGR